MASSLFSLLIKKRWVSFLIQFKSVKLFVYLKKKLGALEFYKKNKWKYKLSFIMMEIECKA